MPSSGILLITYSILMLKSADILGLEKSCLENNEGEAERRILEGLNCRGMWRILGRKGEEVVSKCVPERTQRRIRNQNRPVWLSPEHACVAVNRTDLCGFHHNRPGVAVTRRGFCGCHQNRPV